jgi:hypothetical protein
MKRLNPDMISHGLSLCGMSAYRATILEMAERINEIQEAVEDLQGLVSAEIMGGLAKASELREVVAELGAGWRIERQPQSIPAPSSATTVEDVDRPMAFVHSPGFPADDGETCGADELTDTGLTYRELHQQLTDFAPKPNGLGTPGVSWLRRDDWVTQLAAAVDGA